MVQCQMLDGPAVMPTTSFWSQIWHQGCQVEITVRIHQKIGLLIFAKQENPEEELQKKWMKQMDCFN